MVSYFIRRLCFLLIFIWMNIEFFSCRNENHKEFIMQTYNQRKDVHDCTTAKDTIFEDGDYIKYISRDSLFGVTIRWKSHTDTMNFTFNCDVTNNLIPSFFSRHENKLFLKQGSGSSYRKIFLYEIIKNSLTLSEYETNLVDLNSPNVMFFKNRDENDQLYLINLDTKMIHPFAKLSSHFSKMEIKECQVFDSYIKVLFIDGSELDFKFHKRDLT